MSDLTLPMSSTTNQKKAANTTITVAMAIRGTHILKQRVIDKLTDEKSDIHLLIWRYTPKDFKNVNFKQILQKYARNEYKMIKYC